MSNSKILRNRKYKITRNRKHNTKNKILRF